MFAELENTEKIRQKQPETPLPGKLTRTSPRVGQVGDADPAEEAGGSGL